MISIKKLRVDDIKLFSPLVREADVIEAIKGFGDQSKVEDILFDSMVTSKECFTVWHHDEPIAMFGISRTARDDVGMPWLVCSENIKFHKRKTIKYARRYLQKCFNEGYKKLSNAVDPDNVKAKAFIRHLGFTFTGETIVTDAGYDFELFERGR
jgi:hypothetical protein